MVRFLPLSMVVPCPGCLTPPPSSPGSTNPKIQPVAAVYKFRPLSPSTASRLASYSSTAAVGALSLASSNAAIVYVNAGNTLLPDPIATDTFFGIYPYDLNSDGVSDLRFAVRAGTSEFNPSRAVVIAANQVGSAVGVIGQTIDSYPYADRLAAGALIDGSSGFLVLTQQAANPASMAFGQGYPNSQWAFAGSNSGYLGVRFNIGSAEHFAWMRLTVEPESSATPRAITVHEWAFEDAPGIGIETGAVPEPSALGLLALGSVGLSARRRRKLA